MSEIILPQSFLLLCAAFQPCFTAPSYRTFQWLMAGWLQCPGRRTITAVAVAAGALDQRHISVYHRFFSRAQWSLDAVGRVLFTLASAWLPADQPLYLLLDDTLARKHGKSISLATMHHDPLLSTARKPFFSFGHVWVVLALWTPCRWVVPAAWPSRSCSACTSGPSAAGSGPPRPGRTAVPATTRR
jgi:hypothetical protein